MFGKLRQKIEQRFSTVHILVFAQFLLIMLVLISLILFTSSSFYKSMLENMTSFTLQDSATEIEKLDFNSEDIIEKIHEIELKNFVFIEIFGKSNQKSDTFDVPIYMQYSHNVFTYGSKKLTKTTPFIDYKESNFEKQRIFNKSTETGVFNDVNGGYKYYMMRYISQDGSKLFTIVVHEAMITAQADAISIAVAFILMITFLLITVIGYLYITRVTRPLKDIRNVTKEMVETNDITIRIPEIKRSIRTETDETISSVNYLYEQLILTQEGLKEKTEFLANQLEAEEIEKKAREEFIASSSHELKTPISIIQGYAEGAKFLANDPEALNEYCDTIIDECIRMTNLVVNMMSLANLQHTRKADFVDFSIRDFIAERMKMYDKIFKKHNIKPENLDTHDIYGKADPEKLPFVMNNLVSNAIAYIGGERILRVRYEDLGSIYRIFVFNSGKPIPQPELEKLWNSFYRQDPARNRNEGHFGLGLSIVKSIQDAHSQQCGVDNADGGVEFWFDILK